MNQDKQLCNGFQQQEKVFIPTIESEAFVYEHSRSGAKLIYLKNEDPHKAFTITFKTPPTDDTGVAHIVEHSVCCSSDKYPFKDTFIELDKSSVNTALNACTYKDMTMYYGASLHEKDLVHIIDVFMDLVLHPKMYEEHHIFKQEGWHYELESKRAPLQYNGIVYNEMKGEYSEVSAFYEYEMHRALFPDTCYQYDSGGVPQVLTSLTEEAFLDFHRKHYVPSNSYLYLYGDLEIDAILKMLDEAYLQHYEKTSLHLPTTKQQAFKKQVNIRKHYPLSDREDTKQKTLMSMSFVVGEATDGKLRLAFQMLEHMLLKSAASPLYKVLVEEMKLGRTMGDSGYDPGKYQPTFSIVLNDCKEGLEDVFEETMRTTLERLVREGLSKDLVDAAFHTVSFGLYEGDQSSEPKGILYSEDILMSAMYGGDPFAHLQYATYLEELEKEKDQGFFETLITTYLIENRHSVRVVLNPSQKLAKQQEKQLAKKLAETKKGLTDAHKQQLIKEAQGESVDETDSVTAVMPRLSKEDVSVPPQFIQYEKQALNQATLLWHEERTRHIVYAHFLFDGSVIPQGDLPYVALLAHILTYIGTKNATYEQLENRINQTMGGLHCSINGYSHCKDTNNYKPYFKVSCKCLEKEWSQTCAILKEIFCDTRFDEKEKIRDLIQLMQHDYERSFISTPEYRAVKRAYTYFSKAAVYEDIVSGVAFYGFLTDLCKHFEREYLHVVAKLEEVYKKLITSQGLIISVTGEEKGKEDRLQKLEEVICAMPHKIQQKHTYTLEPVFAREGFVIASDVQAIAKGMLLTKDELTFTGSMYVVSHLMNTSYLWDTVRLEGGAYGSDMVWARDGSIMLSSYCDPNLTETLKLFGGIGVYLSTCDLTEEMLESYIVGTIGGMDYPSSMEQKSEQVVLKYLCEIDDEMLRRERQEVLNTTIQTVRDIGQRLQVCRQNEKICVIGNSKKIKANKQLFERIATIQQMHKS